MAETSKVAKLIDVPKDSPTRKQRVEAFKKEHGIWTHGNKKNGVGDHAWDALSVLHAHAGLDGYGLTEIQRLEPMALVSAYCRLLDEWGLLVTGETEVKAIRTLCRNIDLPCDL